MIYLNNAATSYPKPKEVSEAVINCLALPDLGQFRSTVSNENTDVIAECRHNLAKLFHTENENRFFFTSGATESLNTIINGLDLCGKHLITTVIEHNSVLRPLITNYQEAFKKDQTKLSFLHCDEYGKIDTAQIENKIKQNTIAIIINHCSNVTGALQDIQKVSRIAHKNNIMLILDASQSAGGVDVNIDEMHIDILIFTGHKGLMGIKGSGGFYLAPHIILKPLKFGGTGKDSDKILITEKDYDYEVGTMNTPSIVALNQGVKFILKTGLQQIMKREQFLMASLYHQLALVDTVKIYAKDVPEGTALSFNMIGLLPSDVAYILNNGYDIIVRTGLHCCPLIHRYLHTEKYGTVRVSISYFTTEEEIDRFVEAIRDISASMKKED